MLSLFIRNLSPHHTSHVTLLLVWLFKIFVSSIIKKRWLCLKHKPNSQPWVPPVSLSQKIQVLFQVTWFPYMCMSATWGCHVIPYHVTWASSASPHYVVSESVLDNVSVNCHGRTNIYMTVWHWACLRGKTRIIVDSGSGRSRVSLVPIVSRSIHLKPENEICILHRFSLAL